MLALFGKLPARRDFIARGVPNPVLERIEPWLQEAMAQSRATLGAAWLPAYLAAPLWRFWWSASAAGSGAAGVLMPSVDKVGRYFPLMALELAPHGRDLAAPRRDHAPWFERVETALLTALSHDATLDALLHAARHGAARPRPLGRGADGGHPVVDGRRADPPAAPRGMARPAAPNRLRADAGRPPRGAGGWCGKGVAVVKFRFNSAAGTHEGCVRTRNEDALLADPDHGLWVVADGMGGEAAGDHASATVIAAMTTIGQATSADDLLGRTHDRLTRAHRELVEYAREREARVVGAAVVVLLAFEEYVACVWSGDSRLYRLRDNRLAQLSRDHNEVGELLARNVITREEALAWKGRNAITRAVGVYDELETEVLYGDLRAGDIFVLCSDGLPLHVSDDEIRDAIVEHGPTEAVAALIERALSRGGEDNVSVIVVRADVDPDQTTVFQPLWRVR